MSVKTWGLFTFVVLLAMSYKHMLMINIIHFFVKGCTISWLITTTAVIKTSITCTVLSYLCSWSEACYLISLSCVMSGGSY